MKKKEVSACTKLKEHQGQAQKGLLKHLPVTAAGMRLPSASATLGCQKKRVSACTKFKEHRGQAQKALFKHLLVTGPRMRLLQGTAIFG